MTSSIALQLVRFALVLAVPVAADVVSDAYGLARKGWDLRMGQREPDPAGAGALVTGVGFIMAGMGEFVKGTHSIKAAKEDARKLMLSEALKDSQTDLLELNGTISGGFSANDTLPVIARDSHALIDVAHTLHDRAESVLNDVEGAMHHYFMGAYFGGAGGLACLIAGAMNFNTGWLLCSVAGAAVEITSGVWAILASDDADKAKGLRNAMEAFMQDAKSLEDDLVWDSVSQTFSLTRSVDDVWTDVARLGDGLSTARARLREILPRLEEEVLLAVPQPLYLSWPSSITTQTSIVMVFFFALTNVGLSLVQLTLFLRRRAMECPPVESYMVLSP